MYWFFVWLLLVFFFHRSSFGVGFCDNIQWNGTKLSAYRKTRTFNILPQCPVSKCIQLLSSVCVWERKSTTFFPALYLFAIQRITISNINKHPLIGHMHIFHALTGCWVILFCCLFIRLSLSSCCWFLLLYMATMNSIGGFFFSYSPL